MGAVCHSCKTLSIQPDTAYKVVGCLFFTHAICISGFQSLLQNFGNCKRRTMSLWTWNAPTLNVGKSHGGRMPL